MRKFYDFFSARDELIHQRDTLIHERDKLIRERDASSSARPHDPIPGVLLNTLPKSASVFILETLANTLGKPIIAVSPGYFPHDQIDFRRLGALISSRGIAQSHLDASPFNQRYLRKIEKVIVQFRDPRQATLSWLHHLERLFREGQQDFLFTVTPELPDNYFALDLVRKIDYQLMHYLPQVCEWQAEWIAFIDQSDDPAHFMLTSYEAFVVDSERYFTSLFEFLGCPTPDAIDVHSVLPTTEKNFRKGETDEWRSVFSDAQADRATAAIPLAMQARFGWC